MCAGSRARYRAQRRLIAELPERWQELYDEERSLGEEESLERQIERLRVQLAEIRQAETDGRPEEPDQPR